MGLKWTDAHDIAIELEDAHPGADVANLRFTDLWQWVQALRFEDDPRNPMKRYSKPFKWLGLTSASEVRPYRAERQ